MTNMRLAFWMLASFALLLAAPSWAADPADVKGLWLVTDYPAITARAGESASIKLKLQNAGLAPETVTLSVADVPPGWKAVLLGGGSPVGAAMAATNDSVPLQLRLDIPDGAPAGTHRLTIHAAGSDVNADLPIDVTIGEVLPAKLTIKTSLPSLRGTTHSSFDYAFSVKNEGDKDLLVRLAAQAPQGFQTSFTDEFGSQEISSVPIEAGQSKDLKLKVQPAGGAPAADYPVAVQASAAGVAANATMTVEITGEPKLSLTGAEEGRLSVQAEAGKPMQVRLVVGNDGSAPAQDIDLSGAPPSDWIVTFDQKKIDRLGPGEKKTVQATLTPSARAIAGDYMLTFTASDNADSASSDFRVTVATSTLWGIVGIGIIAIALLVAVGAVARFGRR
jgi:uncharacterized membrane protein